MSEAVHEARRLLEARQRELRNELRQVEAALKAMGVRRRGRPSRSRKRSSADSDSGY
jgi:hypothetical protein